MFLVVGLVDGADVPRRGREGTKGTGARCVMFPWCVTRALAKVAEADSGQVFAVSLPLFRLGGKRKSKKIKYARPDEQGPKCSTTSYGQFSLLLSSLAIRLACRLACPRPSVRHSQLWQYQLVVFYAIPSFLLTSKNILHSVLATGWRSVGLAPKLSPKLSTLYNWFPGLPKVMSLKFYLIVLIIIII